MSIPVHCPKCQREFDVSQEAAGGAVQCVCGHEFAVPLMAQLQEDPSPSSVESASSESSEPLEPLVAERTPLETMLPVLSSEHLESDQGGQFRDDPSATSSPQTEARSEGKSAVVWSVLAAIGSLAVICGATMTWVQIRATPLESVDGVSAFRIQLSGLGDTSVHVEDAEEASTSSIAKPDGNGPKPSGWTIASVGVASLLASVLIGVYARPRMAASPLVGRLSLMGNAAGLFIVVLYLAWIGKAVALSREIHRTLDEVDGLYTWRTMPSVGIFLGIAGGLVSTLAFSSLAKKHAAGLAIRIVELGTLASAALLAAWLVAPWQAGSLWQQLSEASTAIVTRNQESANPKFQLSGDVLRYQTVLRDAENFKRQRSRAKKEETVHDPEFLAAAQELADATDSLVEHLRTTSSEEFNASDIEKLTAHSMMAHEHLNWRDISPLLTDLTGAAGPDIVTQAKPGKFLVYRTFVNSNSRTSWYQFHWKEDVPDLVALTAPEARYVCWIDWAEAEEIGKHPSSDSYPAKNALSCDVVIHEISSGQVVYKKSFSATYDVEEIDPSLKGYGPFRTGYDRMVMMILHEFATGPSSRP